MSQTEPQIQAPQSQPTYYGLLILAGLALGFALINTLPHETADEGFHAPTVWEYYNHNYGYINPYIAMFPTYHHIVAWFMRQIGKWDVSILRAVNLLIGVLAIPVFSSLVRRFHPGEERVRTAQFFFFPLFFPFFFLVYTDIWGLLAVLITILLTIDKRHWPAGLAGLLAVLLRQHNILWVGFCLLWIMFAEVGPALSWKSAGPALRALFRQGWLHLIVCASFVAFVIINKGVAIGDRGSNPFVIHVTNFYTFLIWSWVLLLPFHCTNLPAIVGLLRRRWVLPLVLAGFFVYLGTYNNWHPLNQPGSYYYLRNKLLTVMTESTPIRAMLYVPIAWSTLSFATLSFPDKRCYLLYFVGTLSIILMPVIEPRYYIPALALLLAFRPKTAPRVETLSVGYNTVLATVLTYCIAQQFFFP